MKTALLALFAVLAGVLLVARGTAAPIPIDLANPTPVAEEVLVEEQEFARAPILRFPHNLIAERLSLAGVTPDATATLFSGVIGAGSDLDDGPFWNIGRYPPPDFDRVFVSELGDTFGVDTTGGPFADNSSGAIIRGPATIVLTSLAVAALVVGLGNGLKL